MPTALTPQAPLGPYPSLPVAANGLDFTWEAGDVTGNTFTGAGHDLLLVRNDDVGAQTFTIASQPDSLNREGDVSDYSVGAGEYAAFWFGNVNGWRASDGSITVTPSSANLKFAVLRIPD